MSVLPLALKSTPLTNINLLIIEVEHLLWSIVGPRADEPVEKLLPIQCCRHVEVDDAEATIVVNEKI